jgi:TonB family protein
MTRLAAAGFVFAVALFAWRVAHAQDTTPATNSSSPSPSTAVPSTSGTGSQDASSTPARPLTGRVESARIIHQVAPIYPEAAKAAGISGTVVVKCVIAADGTVKDAEVISGPDELRDAALTAVRQWTYQPTTVAGHPVAVDSQVSVVFQNVPTPAAGTMAGDPAAAAVTNPDAPLTSKPMVIVERVATDQLIRPLSVVYPAEAIASNTSGTVILQVLIDEDGSVGAQRVVSGPEALRKAAANAVIAAQYRPMTLDGKPTTAATTVRIVFTLDTATNPSTGTAKEDFISGGQAEDSAALASQAPFAQAYESGHGNKLGNNLGVTYNVKPARLIHQVQPVYPRKAKSKGIQGQVVMHATIQKDGTIRDLKYMSGPEELAQAAMDAVQQWTYVPTILLGKPVEVDTTITVVFTLGSKNRT